MGGFFFGKISMGRFANPYPQFEDSTPTLYSGGKLFFYAAGTSTPQNTYTDAGLTSANTNPVILNSAGRPATDIFLQDLGYKVVLEDSSGNLIWTADNYTSRDSKLIAKTVTGNGSPNGSVAGTAGSASILPDFYWDFTNAILYVCTTTGSSSTAVWTAVNAASAAAIVPPPQGYLTLTSGTPVITGDVTAATSVFYTPYVGNLVPIYNGSSFIPTTFAEQTLTLSSSHAASNIYDVFMFNNSGVPTVVTGPSWSAGTSGNITAGSCARGTGAGGTTLTRVGGILTNAVQITGRNGATTFTIGANLATYLGTIFMDGTNGQISCHVTYGQSRKWGVWNAYNRVPLQIKAGDGTATWSYTTNTIRAANGSSANSITVLQGLPEESYEFATTARVTSANLAASQTSGGIVGIGFNSTTAISGQQGEYIIGGGSGVTGNAINSLNFSLYGKYVTTPSLGINVITALETSGGVITSATYNGGEANMLLTAKWRG